MATEPRVSTGEIATTSSPATETIPVFKQDQVNKNLATTDTGTDAPTVTLQQSQATSQAPTGAIPYNSYTGVSSADLGTTAFIAPASAADPNAGLSSADLGTTAYIAPTSAVVAKAPPADASISDTKSGTDKIFNAASNPGNPITPSPNVLDQFASYTYSLSWYLLTPQQANVMSSTSKINTNEWSLLMQSGGAAPPVTPTAPAPATAPGNGTLFQDTGAGTTTNSFGQAVNNNLAGGV